MAQPQQEFNANLARLPRHLHQTLLKLHITKLSLGLLLLALGVSCIIKYKSNAFIIIVGASISSLITGSIGLLAIHQRSLVLHGGATLTAAISLYLSLLVYVACTAAAAMDNNDTWLVIMSGLVSVIDILSATLNAGVELSVMYVAVSTQRAVRKNLSETGGEP